MTHNNRIIWIDQAKGIGIFLVVVGHMLRALINSNIVTDNFWVTFVDRWIYTFHMIKGEYPYAKDNWLQPTESMPFTKLH